ncbi:hypothetical protein OIU76_004130 [Salix suchowensis]|nr:hypothetical protein OIU76_004130 [Salix suchowensis]
MAAFTFPSIKWPANPSRQVLSSVSAALTQVCTLLICHKKSRPTARPV